jgi:hypothetical protein
MRILCSSVTLTLGLTLAASNGCGGKSEQSLAGSGVDDYNLGGTVPRGGLVSVNVNGAMLSLPAATRVEVPPNAYTVDHTVLLGFLLPLEAGEVHAPFSCTTADAGTSR